MIIVETKMFLKLVCFTLYLYECNGDEPNLNSTRFEPNLNSTEYDPNLNSTGYEPNLNSTEYEPNLNSTEYEPNLNSTGYDPNLNSTDEELGSNYTLIGHDIGNGGYIGADSPLGNYPVLGCGNIFVSESGTFWSPNYPSYYPLNQDCEWQIIVPLGNRIVLSFSSFEVEPHPTCSYDYVMVSEGNTLLDVLCGSVIPNPITSNGNMLNIRFHSDTLEPANGFIASFIAEPLEVTSTTAPASQLGEKTSDVSSDMLTVILAAIGVIVVLGVVGLSVGLIFCKHTKDRVQDLQKKSQRIRPKRGPKLRTISVLEPFKNMNAISVSPSPFNSVANKNDILLEEA